MLGFHARQKSLISIKELKKQDIEVVVQYIEPELEMETSDDDDTRTTKPSRQRRNLVLIYLLFLGEAIMASSLSAQVVVLVPASAGCMGIEASFLRSFFECAYFAGCTAGFLWGWCADRAGRRLVAMSGLSGMAVCCLGMGFATSITSFAALRFLAGVVSSAVTTAGLAMLADITQGTKSRVAVVARLPIISLCGSAGSFAANAIRVWSDRWGFAVFHRYPGLSGQLACSSLVCVLALAELVLLEETLPMSVAMDAYDCEKAALLDDSDDLLTLAEALDDRSATTMARRLSTGQLVNAPSIVMLLASFSILSLHSITFDELLPHISHNVSHAAGLGLRCSWVSTIKLLIAFCAAVSILHLVPRLIERVGLLNGYRRMIWAFPALFITIPLAGLAVGSTGAASWLPVVSIAAMLAKATVAGAAQVLALLLILAAAPDTQSTGQTIGILSLAELFKALSVGLSGLSYYLSDDLSMLALNSGSWGILAAFAVAGAIITRKLRETPRVGADIPESCLTWQSIFDADSETDEGP
ncbi:hypothetical protein LTR56_020868 [Elasticomyces elasticus]|nr:hypothetical protein LTR56_020868 [Elasticomyces elasticus]KAK3652231.1 hypothetical protein LTR22_011732 [Elasticomyces elasticus]KAK4909924.1 hypothetical protein LTR49_021329 [Elasticomyces elasticus]KAK5751618.1 hypothetical protein LTS12_018323 [Elasticomyces elasticus]